MRALRILPVLFLVLLTQVIPAYFCFADPSGDFQREKGDVFDDWHVCRTRPNGQDGYLAEIYTGRGWPPERFRPIIVFESLGEWADTAYSLGQQFADKYPDRHQRAEEVFYFVRDRVRYVHDSDQFGYGEFAQNADELADTIVGEGRASGDCEDMAIILAVMYQGAGFRSAIVDCENHVGVVVYLPGYQKANVVFELDGESGWIWSEATGSTNPFGWFPMGQIEGALLAYEVSAEPISLWEQPPERPPTIAWSPRDLIFSATEGGQNPASQTLDIRNSGEGVIAWSVTDDAPWLTLSPASGTCTSETDEITLWVDISGMRSGSYRATVTISAPGAANSPQTVSVGLDIAPPSANLSPWIVLFFGIVGLMLAIIIIRARLGRRRRTRPVWRR